MQRLIVTTLLTAATAGLAPAQVTLLSGTAANTQIDFDNPMVASGPIAPNSPVFTAAGISSINPLGSTNIAGDVVSAAANWTGQTLVYDGGVLAVAGLGDPLDNFDANGGWEIVLANPVDEFQASFVDQAGMTYDVELLSGGSSIAMSTFTYQNSAPGPIQAWRGPGPFDTIRITFPAAAGTGGVGLDNLGLVNGPAPMPPSNDECTNAINVTLGSTPFSTRAATDSATGFACVGTAGKDVWFSFTASSSRDLVFETCGSNFDTVMEVYTNTCAAPVTVACNDDVCVTQSRIVVTGANAGDTFLVQIGGFDATSGEGNLEIYEDIPVANCVETLFNSDNGGNDGGAVYFDMTVGQSVEFTGLTTNSGLVAGLPVGISVYTAPVTSVGNEGSPGAWTLVAEDDGNAIAAGEDEGTMVTFAQPFQLAPGSYGIAITGENLSTGETTDFEYTNGNGSNQMFQSPDGVLSLSLGAASNTPFGGTIFTPRVWNGELCYNAGSGVGTNYCMANANSTGTSAVMSASGSVLVANNDLVLESSNMPNNSFAFFLTSQTQGFVTNPGGSSGNLCLSGAIGRFVGPGQIQSTMQNGGVSLAIDNSMQPTPTGLVQIQAGETWNFTCWFRDVAPGGSATSNFADGLEVMFL